jgi:hypothetical protein
MLKSPAFGPVFVVLPNTTGVLGVASTMFTVRLSVALHGTVQGDTIAVPVGTPNERATGEADTVCASKL